MKNMNGFVKSKKITIISAVVGLLLIGGGVLTVDLVNKNNEDIIPTYDNSVVDESSNDSDIFESSVIESTVTTSTITETTTSSTTTSKTTSKTTTTKATTKKDDSSNKETDSSSSDNGVGSSDSGSVSNNTENTENAGNTNAVVTTRPIVTTTGHIHNYVATQVKVRDAYDEKVLVTPATSKTVNYYRYSIYCSCGLEFYTIAKETSEANRANILRQVREGQYRTHYSAEMCAQSDECAAKLEAGWTYDQIAEWSATLEHHSYTTGYTFDHSETETTEAVYTTVHHDAEYKTVYKCSCGATK